MLARELAYLAGPGFWYAVGALVALYIATYALALALRLTRLRAGLDRILLC